MTSTNGEPGGPGSALGTATVADAMHKGIISCEADADLAEVADEMSSGRVHCVAVVGASGSRPGDSDVWGIISDEDVVRAGLRTSLDRPAGTVALQPVVTVSPEMPLTEAGELMLEHRVAHVVVVDAATRRPVGILSLLDITGLLARPLSGRPEPTGPRAVDGFRQPGTVD